MDNHMADTTGNLVQRASLNASQIRKQFHQIPELMFEEFQTADLIRQELSRMGIDYVTPVKNAPTATIAHIGDPSRPCVALRADIDALPVTEATNLPYASLHMGRMHACGHDGHVACLLGAAEVLKEMEMDLPVCVKLLFQPAEEGGGGAERLIEAGVIDGRVGPKPVAIYGLHGWPSLPVGKVSTRPGTLLASTDNFVAIFHGKGSHGAYPHLGKDPVVAACEAVLSLQQIISREVDPLEPAVITVGKIYAGTAVNVIPETACIEGTARALSQGTRSLLQKALDRRLRGIATAHDVELEFKWTEGYPPTINDQAETQYVADTARRILGNDAFIPAATASMGGEDFAYYLEKIPGCFFVMGVAPETGVCPGLHSPWYDFNDATIPYAIRLLVGLVIGRAQ